MKTVALWMTVAAMLMLIGCGQRGPLYLPDDGSEAVEKTEPAAAAEDETDKTKEKP